MVTAAFQLPLAAGRDRQLHLGRACNRYARRQPAHDQLTQRREYGDGEDRVTADVGWARRALVPLSSLAAPVGFAWGVIPMLAGATAPVGRWGSS